MPGIPQFPQSPVAHLFAANVLPNEAERELIRVAIGNAQTSLATLAELEDPQAKEEREASRWAPKKPLTVLAKRRRDLNDFIHSHQALLLPIRELPPELLQEIFHHYYTLFITWFTFQRDARPPFILTQVCTAWRSAAIALPSLWVKNPAFNLNRGKTREAGYLSFVEELFRRSGGFAMLEVYVYYYPLSGKAENHPVMDILVRHSERLKILTLDGNQGTLDVFAGAKGRLPNLIQLGLHIPATTEDQWQTPGVVVAKNNTFEEAPKLEVVKMPRKTRPAWFVLPPRTIIKFDNEPLQWSLKMGGES